MCHIQDESKEEIAYAQDMFETIFKDYALKTYNKDVGEKAAEYVAQGITYDQYYAAYFAARGIVGDKGDNGKQFQGLQAERRRPLSIRPFQAQAQSKSTFCTRHSECQRRCGKEMPPP